MSRTQTYRNLQALTNSTRMSWICSEHFPKKPHGGAFIIEYAVLRCNFKVRYMSSLRIFSRVLLTSAVPGKLVYRSIVFPFLLSLCVYKRFFYFSGFALNNYCECYFLYYPNGKKMFQAIFSYKNIILFIYLPFQNVICSVCYHYYLFYMLSFIFFQLKFLWFVFVSLLFSSCLSFFYSIDLMHSFSK